MTKVRFTFVDVQGNPLPLLDFKILLRRASFNIEDVGVILPEEMDVVTDASGQVIVELWPLKTAYRVRIAPEHEELCGKLNWAFYVPHSDEIIEAQTLFLEPPPSPVPWDEEAMGKITQAVQDTQDNKEASAQSAADAKVSAEAADVDADAAALSASQAASSAGDALASKNAAKGSEDAAALLAEQARVSAVNSGNSATASAGSATAAANSASTAASAGTTSGTAAANAVVANKQDKHVNLTAFSGLTGAADRIPYFTGAGALSLATLTAKARALLARTDSAGMRAEITAASSGANSDITRLSGLTTALSVGQGGTGGTDAASARAGLGLGTTGNYDVLPVTKGGTGGINQSEGRAGLGLGSAATANTGTDPGNVMPVGAFGLGNRVNPVVSSMNRWTTGFSVISDGTQHRPVSYGTLIDVGYPGGSLGSQLWMGVVPGGLIGFRSGDYADAAFNIIYHTGNTTRAADGTLKAI